LTIHRWPGGKITGVAADTKPTSVPNATEFFETDTKKRYYFDTTTACWIPYTQPNWNSYRVFKIGSTTFVTSKENRIVGSGTDTVDVIQAVLDTTSTNNGYEFVWDAGNWVMTKPIIWPTVTKVVPRWIRMIGCQPHWARTSSNGGTRLVADACWPDSRYFFELNRGSSEVINGFVWIENFSATIGNAPQPTKVGFLKLESGNLNLGRNYHIARNLFLEYMWRGIHIRGMTWWGVFENIRELHSSSAFTQGDSFILIEDAEIVDPLVNPSPKASIFQNITATSGDGTYNSFLKLRDHGYGTFRDMFIDGKFFYDAVIDIDGNLGVSKNYFENISLLDLEYPASKTTQASLLLRGNGVYDNVFRQCHFPNYPEAVVLSGSGVQDNKIEIDAIWGTALSKVTDTTADPTNTIEIYGRSNPNVAHGKITHVGGTSRIIDKRRGAQKSGTAVVSDGSTVSHGLFATPLWVMVQSRIAGEFVSVTGRTSTTFTVAIRTNKGAPGTSSQIIDWQAGVYS
jgi:hypothetical protein